MKKLTKNFLLAWALLSSPLYALELEEAQMDAPESEAYVGEMPSENATMNVASELELLLEPEMIAPLDTLEMAEKGEEMAEVAVAQEELPVSEEKDSEDPAVSFLAEGEAGQEDMVMRSPAIENEVDVMAEDQFLAHFSGIINLERIGPSDDLTLLEGNVSEEASEEVTSNEESVSI